MTGRTRKWLARGGRRTGHGPSEEPSASRAKGSDFQPRGGLVPLTQVENLAPWRRSPEGNRRDSGGLKVGPWTVCLPPRGRGLRKEGVAQARAVAVRLNPALAIRIAVGLDPASSGAPIKLRSSIREPSRQVEVARTIRRPYSRPRVNALQRAMLREADGVVETRRSKNQDREFRSPRQGREDSRSPWELPEFSR